MSHDETTPFFPFTLYCSCKYGNGEPSFRKLLSNSTPKDMIWYGYNVIVESLTHVKFEVYDMDHAVYGGIGHHIGTYPAVEASPELIKPFLRTHALQLAKERLQREQELREQQILSQYADDLLDLLVIKS